MLELPDIEISQHSAVGHLQSRSLRLTGDFPHAFESRPVRKHIDHLMGDATRMEPSHGISAPKTTGFDIDNHIERAGQKTTDSQVECCLQSPQVKPLLQKRRRPLMPRFRAMG